MLLKRQFYGVRARAANIAQTAGNYTAEMFFEDFPQFFTPVGEPLLPEGMLESFIELTNSSIAPDKWGGLFRLAAGLFMAHNATLYLRAYRDGSCDAATAASSGDLVGIVASATLGDASVSYDTSALVRATEQWGDLNSTIYGQQLATKARLVGLGGSYVI